MLGINFARHRPLRLVVPLRHLLPQRALSANQRLEQMREAEPHLLASEPGGFIGASQVRPASLPWMREELRPCMQIRAYARGIPQDGVRASWLHRSMSGSHTIVAVGARGTRPCQRRLLI